MNQPSTEPGFRERKKRFPHVVESSKPFVIDVRVFQVRRLSTVSSVLAASGHVFRTTWKWYWQDEHDQWHCYDSGNADVSSEKIEQQFTSGINTCIFIYGHFRDGCIVFSWENVTLNCLEANLQIDIEFFLLGTQPSSAVLGWLSPLIPHSCTYSARKSGFRYF